MRKVLFIAIVVLTGCQSKNQHWKMDVPVHLNSNQRAGLSKLLPDSVRQKETTKAILFESGDATSYIIIDGFRITLQTLNAEGVQVDTVRLIKGFGNEDYISDVTINADKTIIKIDSSFANFYENPDDIENSVLMRSVSIDTAKYRITDGGKIERVDE